MNNGNWNVKAELARVSVGRVVLHVACAVCDGRVQWHWEGIKRELPLTSDSRDPERSI